MWSCWRELTWKSLEMYEKGKLTGGQNLARNIKSHLSFSNYEQVRIGYWLWLIYWQNMALIHLLHRCTKRDPFHLDYHQHPAQYHIKLNKIWIFWPMFWTTHIFTPMHVTEKNSTDSSVGRRPVWVTRRTNPIQHLVTKFQSLVDTNFSQILKCRTSAFPDITHFWYCF